MNAELEPKHLRLVKPLNQRQLGKLDAFEHVLSQIALHEPQAEKGLEWTITQTYSSGVTVKTVIFDIDERLIGTLNRVAFGLYRDFQTEPEVKLQADDLLERNDEERTVWKQLEIENIHTIWEAGE